MATATARAIHLLDSENYLPESDGKPMAETDRHRLLMIYLLIALEEFFRKEPSICVSGNIFVYYRNESKMRKSISPDIFVVRGIKKKDRRIYNLDVERKAPEVIIELTSSETKTEDLGNKRVIYASLGVKEYFLYDPYNETMQPALRGFRLENGDYMPIVGTRLRSNVLGLELRHENGELRLYDPKTEEYLRTHAESEEELRRTQKRVAQELRVRQRTLAKLAAAETRAAARKPEPLNLKPKISACAKNWRNCARIEETATIDYVLLLFMKRKCELVSAQNRDGLFVYIMRN